MCPCPPTSHAHTPHTTHHTPHTLTPAVLLPHVRVSPILALAKVPALAAAVVVEEAERPQREEEDGEECAGVVRLSLLGRRCVRVRSPELPLVGKSTKSVAVSPERDEKRRKEREVRNRNLGNLVYLLLPLPPLLRNLPRE